MSFLRELSLPAIEFRQGPRHVLYTFAIDAKELPRIAAVSRLHRGAAQDLRGYQRPQVLSHIASIRQYLDSPDPLMPNALVVAFDRRVVFRPTERESSWTPYARSGLIVIPVDDSWDDDEKPGWLVDGQQRTAAVQAASIAAFPMCVTAFITDSEEEQRSQFILVNSTKPLPKGLIYELLPATRATLPVHLQRRRLPSQLLERLNLDSDSPMHNLIAVPTNPLGVVKDNSVLRMLENSLSDGALSELRVDSANPESLANGLVLIKEYWWAVRNTFAGAWGVSPRKSRLMHGVGIVSMGFIMDAIAERFLPRSVPDRGVFAADLASLADRCHWTQGYWEFGPQAIRRWNELQNTPRDVQLLANHLLFEYRRRVLEPVLGRRIDAQRTRVSVV